MSSSQPRQLIESNYKLALKFFMNKNFGKSYEIIKKLYQASFKQYASDIINEQLFIKIVNLYLTEIGLFIDKDNKDTNFSLGRNERQEVIAWLGEDQILDELYDTFDDDINAIPSEIMYNLFLIYYINQSIISTESDFLKSRLDKIYYLLDHNSRKEDTYLKKIVDLYVYQVLPDYENYEDATLIIKENPLYQSQIDSSLDRLDTVRINKVKQKHEKENEEKEEQKKLKEKKQRDLQKQKELKDLQNLSYKSLNQIKQSSQQIDISKKGDETPRADPRMNIELLRHKLLYTLNLSKDYIKENSPLILLIIMVLFISSRFIRLKRINIMDRLKQTLQMAFKISYL